MTRRTVFQAERGSLGGDVLTTIANEDLLDRLETFGYIFTSLVQGAQDKTGLMSIWAVFVGFVRIQLTLRLVSPPGVVASSLTIASLRARTSSEGVRCFVRKKFMVN